MALLYLDPVTGKITAAIQIAQRQLRLRLDYQPRCKAFFRPYSALKASPLLS